MDGHPLLEARELTVRRGERIVLDAVNAAFGAGELVGLIGGAGAGKSAFVGALSGAIVPSGGEVFALGVRLTGAPARRFEQHGIGCIAPAGADASRAVFGRLERALQSEPVNGAERAALRVLLLDEVAAWLGPVEAERLQQLIERLRDELAITVIRAEPPGQLSMHEFDRVIVLHEGRKVADGAPAEVARHASLIDGLAALNHRADRAATLSVPSPGTRATQPRRRP